MNILNFQWQVLQAYQVQYMFMCIDGYFKYPAASMDRSVFDVQWEVSHAYQDKKRCYGLNMNPALY